MLLCSKFDRLASELDRSELERDERRSIKRVKVAPMLLALLQLAATFGGLRGE